MYAVQNTFGFCLPFFPTPLPDPPAVIVIAEVILHDTCEREISRLIWVFNSSVFKRLIYTFTLMLFVMKQSSHKGRGRDARTKSLV